jgi:signal recognition particle subunit SRP54
MFGTLSEKLQGVFSKLAGARRLTEENISEAVREVRLALLDADVNYAVAKTLIKRIKEKAVGAEVLKSVKPGEQFVKVVHDELAALMGEGEAELNLGSGLNTIMLCGLQGSGKTTHCAKLARYLKKQFPDKRTLLVACDLQRPAAVLQLKTLGQQIDVPVFSIDGEQRPIKVAKAALKVAQQDKVHFLIVDTAGRLHIDEQLMDELNELKSLLQPRELLFVANSTTGQDAVNSATAIDAKVSITGSILTMLDGDTRGGAAISIREVTGKPLKFEGVGERLDDLQLFNANSMADRILGMGDVINLVKQAQEHISEEEAEKLQAKMLKATFTYEDYLKQMQSLKKMGSMKKLLKMLPIKGLDLNMLENSEGEFQRVESIILSMTPRERRGQDDLSVSRRRRLARGSGHDIARVNKLIKSFSRAKQFMKKAPKMKQMKQLMGGKAWR